jgi:tRNA/tmRNA/rRNA uracil-C5-methylase (TrmA/RlmC/RlmD family)
VSFRPGDELTDIEIGPVAHGGHFVARHEGMVIFVRGALTGERVDLRLTEVTRRFARGVVTAVRVSSPDRVEPACPIAADCGGCDFQHVAPAASRALKAQVVAEQVRHAVGWEFDGEVEEVSPAPFGWRTRMRYHVDARGRLGLRGHRSHELVPLPSQGCLLAVPEIARPAVPASPTGEVLAVAAADRVVVTDAEDGDGIVTEQVRGRSFEVGLDGFWQAHRGAPDALVAAVLDGLAPAPGEVAADLYCGVGLFAAFFEDAGCQVLGIEGERAAVNHARRNVPTGQFLAGDVGALADRLPTAVDLVVLDPPRAGAGAAVLAAVVARSPRAIAYVACDPAALARDLRVAAEAGYQLASLRAFDLFPMTHHIECVAILKLSLIHISEPTRPY